MESVVTISRKFSWLDVVQKYAHSSWRWVIDNVSYDASNVATVVIPDTIHSHIIRNRLFDCDYPRSRIIESDNTPAQVYRTFDKDEMVQYTSGLKMNPSIAEFVIPCSPPTSNTPQHLYNDVENAVAFFYQSRDRVYSERGLLSHQARVLSEVMHGALYRYTWHDHKDENDVGFTGIGTLKDVVEFADRHDLPIVFGCEPNLYKCTPDIVFHKKLSVYRWMITRPRGAGDVEHNAKFYMTHVEHYKLMLEEFAQ